MNHHIIYKGRAIGVSFMEIDEGEMHGSVYSYVNKKGQTISDDDLDKIINTINQEIWDEVDCADARDAWRKKDGNA